MKGEIDDDEEILCIDTQMLFVNKIKSKPGQQWNTKVDGGQYLYQIGVINVVKCFRKVRINYVYSTINKEGFVNIRG